MRQLPPRKNPSPSVVSTQEEMRKSFEERLLDAIFGKVRRKIHMKVKIQDGTPEFGRSLCYTCKNASIVKGQNGELLVHCNAYVFEHLRNRVPFKVAECGAYLQINTPDRHEMEKIAWIVEARRRGKPGFQIPAGEDQMEVTITKPKKNNPNPIDWPDE